MTKVLKKLYQAGQNHVTAMDDAFVLGGFRGYD